MLSLADERDCRFPAQLRLEVGEALDVGRVRDDDVPALGRRGGALSLPKLDLEPQPCRVLACERQRIGRDVDTGHLRVGPLVLQRERDRARADTDVQDPRPLDPLRECERPLDERLCLGPRYESAGVGLQHQAAEAPLAEHVRERLPPFAAGEERLETVHLVIEARGEPGARRCEEMGDEPLRVDPRRLDAGRGEPPLGLGERFAGGHSPSARRLSSVVSASVNSSSSPCRIRSS